MNWTNEQLAIFDHFEHSPRNLLVIALAGSAKTTSILHGAARAPEKLKLVTAFNKRIADELIAKAPEGVMARTLHSLGLGYLRRHGAPKVDKWRGRNLIRKAWGQLRLENSAFPEGDSEYNKLIAKLVSLAKSVIPFAAHWREFEQLARIYNMAPANVVVQKTGIDLDHVSIVAERAMSLAHTEYKDSIDFDDMIFVPLRKGWVTPAFDLVCCDEQQDMAAGQMELVARALKPGGRFIGVGDPHQAIYQFRGADSGVFNKLRARFNPEELSLTVSFRCARSIIAEARVYVPDIKPFDGAINGRVVSNASDTDVIDRSEEGDFVLSRTNAPLIRERLAFLAAGKRCMIVGAEEFGEAVKNTIHEIWESLDDQSAKAFYDGLSQWYVDEKRDLEKRDLGDDSSKGEWLDDIYEAVDVIARTARNGYAAEFIFEIAARVEQVFSGEPGGVELSTVHKAKGREAERVFVLWPTFPDTHPDSDQARCICGSPRWAHERNEIPAAARCNRVFCADPEWFVAEANIRYVAITRAKKELYFVGR